MASDDDLRRRVEVHGFDDFAAGALGTGAAHVVIRQSDYRGHRTDADRHGLLHRGGAEPDQTHRILERQRARRSQRRVLAQAVACHQRRLGTSGSAPGLVHGETRHQHGGLSIDRQVQVFDGPVFNQ